MQEYRRAFYFMVKHFYLRVANIKVSWLTYRQCLASVFDFIMLCSENRILTLRTAESSLQSQRVKMLRQSIWYLPLFQK